MDVSKEIRKIIRHREMERQLRESITHMTCFTCKMTSPVLGEKELKEWYRLHEHKKESLQDKLWRWLK